MEITSSFAVDDLLDCIGYGRRKAKSSRSIAWEMDKSERFVRRLIEQARRDGFPIMACGDGYFLPNLADPDEMARYERFLAKEKRKAETLMANICIAESYLRRFKAEAGYGI